MTRYKALNGKNRLTSNAMLPFIISHGPTDTPRGPTNKKTELRGMSNGLRELSKEMDAFETRRLS